jgi:hypothetical protein
MRPDFCRIREQVKGGVGDAFLWMSVSLACRTLPDVLRGAARAGAAPPRVSGGRSTRADHAEARHRRPRHGLSHRQVVERRGVEFGRSHNPKLGYCVIQRNSAATLQRNPHALSHGLRFQEIRSFALGSDFLPKRDGHNERRGLTSSLDTIRISVSDTPILFGRRTLDTAQTPDEWPVFRPGAPRPTTSAR